MKSLPIKKLSPLATIPTRAYAHDAGLDLTSIETYSLKSGEGKIFKTGIAIAVEPGFVGLVWDRSSMGKRGIKTAGGVIDAGYRGEVGVILWNLSTEHQEIKAGDRIAQLLIQPVSTPNTIQVEELLVPNLLGARDQGGFGSSGQ